jgi:glutaredoxin
MAKITIYSTTTCPYCVMLKSWLQQQDIKYTEHMVDRDPQAAREMINLSGQMGVPFTTIEKDDGTVEKILGFDRPRFQQTLSAS